MTKTLLSILFLSFAGMLFSQECDCEVFSKTIQKLKVENYRLETENKTLHQEDGMLTRIKEDYHKMFQQQLDEIKTLENMIDTLYKVNHDNNEKIIQLMIERDSLKEANGQDDMAEMLFKKGQEYEDAGAPEKAIIVYNTIMIVFEGTPEEKKALEKKKALQLKEEEEEE